MQRPGTAPENAAAPHGGKRQPAHAWCHLRCSRAHLLGPDAAGGRGGEDAGATQVAADPLALVEGLVAPDCPHWAKRG